MTFVDIDKLESPHHLIIAKIIKSNIIRKENNKEKHMVLKKKD